MKHTDNFPVEDVVDLLNIASLPDLKHFEINEQLGRQIDGELNSWLGKMGLLDDKFRKIGTYSLGRFAMLCYPDKADLEHLTLAAKYFSVLFILDDHYCDDERQGSTPNTWRLMRKMPRRWEYGVNRQFNGALPCTALIDIVGGYELPGDLYYRSAVRRCSVLAGNAVMLGNDLFSAQKEALTELETFSLSRIVASEEECSPRAALERTASAYKEAVVEFREEQQRLFNLSPSELQRYLLGLNSWITGSLEWYKQTARYNL